MDNQDHIKEIEAIKTMMERSSRFLSLSGLSGIFAGFIALAGAVIAFFIMEHGRIQYEAVYMKLLNPLYELEIAYMLMILGSIVLLLALGGGFFFSWRKARKNDLKFWDKTARRMFAHLFIPLVAGGFFSLILLHWNAEGLLASATLIFYGLALLNAGKYTLTEVQYLGISEVILGILAGIFIHYGLFFWAFGFGFLHIFYGSIMYFKYDR